MLLLLTIEITESAALTPTAPKTAATLVDAGFSLSLDDFGTGYASLMVLATLPLQQVKIAREALDIAHRGDRGRIVFRRSVAMAAECGYEVVVEGIENDRDLHEATSASGAALGQGFGLARPLNPARFAHFVAEPAWTSG